MSHLGTCRAARGDRRIRGKRPALMIMDITQLGEDLIKSTESGDVATFLRSTSPAKYVQHSPDLPDGQSSTSRQLKQLIYRLRLQH